jgi:hypothetical protein
MKIYAVSPAALPAVLMGVLGVGLIATPASAGCNISINPQSNKIYFCGEFEDFAYSNGGIPYGSVNDLIGGSFQGFIEKPSGFSFHPSTDLSWLINETGSYEFSFFDVSDTPLGTVMADPTGYYARVALNVTTDGKVNLSVSAEDAINNALVLEFEEGFFPNFGKLTGRYAYFEDPNNDTVDIKDGEYYAAVPEPSMVLGALVMGGITIASRRSRRRG